MNVIELYKNPQKYHRQQISITGYNRFYGYKTPTYSDNYYDLYLTDDLSISIDNEESGLGKDSLDQLVAFNNIINGNKPHVIARIYDKNVKMSFSKTNIIEDKNLTDSSITVYGYFTYNPNTKNYISDPEVYQIEVYAYEFH